MSESDLWSCSVEGCNKSRLYRTGKGYCHMHNTRWKRHGDVDVVLPPKNPNIGLSGKDNVAWKGDAIKYKAMHYRIRASRGKAADYMCIGCTNRAVAWSYDHLDPIERSEIIQNGYLVSYSLDVNHYNPLCASCHNAFDR